MGTSTEHQFSNEQPGNECFQAEYFGFAETDRIDNIPPNFVDEIVIKFLSLNDSLVRSLTRLHISLVVPEVCTKVSAENGLSFKPVEEGVINFKRIESYADVNKFTPVKVLLKIENKVIEICAVDPAIRLLTHSLCNITFCSQGIAHPEYFGFIVTSSVDLPSNLTTSSSLPTSNCQVFRCTSEIQVAQVMQALKSAFSTISSSALQASSVSPSSSPSLLPALFRPQQNPPSTHEETHFLSKALGPIERLNGLCLAIQTKSFAEAHEILERFIEVHHADEHNSILRRVQEAGCETLQETNEIIVSCLLRLAEDKPPIRPQPSHPPRTCSPLSTPSSDPCACPSSVPPSSRYLEASTGNSASELHADGSHWDSSGLRCSSEGIKFSCITEKVNKSRNQFPENSPMRTMFASVGNSLGKMQTKKPRPPSEVMNHLKSRQTSDTYNNNNRRLHHQHRQHQQQPTFPSGSWRFGILNKVVNSSKAGLSSVHYSRYLKDLKQTPAVKINYLWRKAIVDTMYLIKLNRGRNDDEEEEDGFEVPSRERQVRQMKADYDEITPCLIEVTKVWEEMMAVASTKHDFVVNRDIIVSAMRAGVPRNKRGDIWIFLMNQKLLEISKMPHQSSSSSCPQAGTSYKDLLKMWTQHQHAILIDLGRTFPGHPYFSTQLGSGQISLFNILKAYSLLDAEVGYCQGISFVAGILLLHIPEEKSFDVLKFMMFTLNFRRQYCPDMVHLQIQLYQLSRLLHDLHRDLYDHFDRLEISPTLYAAPWFLTIFASQFPLGFVARVFDLIFLQGCEVVIEVAVVLLGNHKELIKQCDSFETVVDFLKTTLPEMSTIQMERIISQAFDLDISKQLDAYKIEYHVLREEMLALKASMISKPKADDSVVKGVTAKHSSPNECATHSDIIQTSLSHHDLTVKVHELNSRNFQLLQQVKELQSKLNSTKISSIDVVDGVSIPNQDQGLLPMDHTSAILSSHFHDLVLYSSNVTSLLHQVRPYLPEPLSSEVDKVVSAKPKWMATMEDSLSTSEIELQNSVSTLSHIASSHPPTLPIRHGHTSSGTPTPFWPLSPLSDGGVGCYLDREVEDFINAGVEVSPSRVILRGDDELKVKTLRNKGQGAPCRQRPSSNYY